MRVRHFVNLTNGLEWISDLPDFSFVRVESTAIEHKDFVRLLRDLDMHFLMCLALGDDCHFYDCGAGKKPSKTVSIGVPFILSTLTDLWIHGKEMEARTKELRALKRKLCYVRRYLTTGTLRLTGHSKRTSRDGDRAYYRQLALSLPGQADAPPAPWLQQLIDSPERLTPGQRDAALAFLGVVGEDHAP